MLYCPDTQNHNSLSPTSHQAAAAVASGATQKLRLDGNAAVKPCHTDGLQDAVAENGGSSTLLPALGSVCGCQAIAAGARLCARRKNCYSNEAEAARPPNGDFVGRMIVSEISTTT